MLRIEISNRHYNGDFGVGSIFEEKYSFEIDENLCYSNSIKSFSKVQVLRSGHFVSYKIAILAPNSLFARFTNSSSRCLSSSVA